MIASRLQGCRPRDSLDLVTPTVVCDAAPDVWPATSEGSDPLSGRVRLGPDPEGRLATASFCVSDGFLLVRVSAAGAAEYDETDHPEWYNRDSVAVLVDPGHDHGTRHLVAIDDRNVLTVDACYIVQGEELNDVSRSELEVPAGASGQFERLAGRTFRATLKMPLASCGTPFGLAIKIGFGESPIPASLAYPEPVPWTRDTPMVFADAFASRPTLSVSRLILDRPRWERRETVLHIRACVIEGSPARGLLRLSVDLPGDCRSELPSIEWAAVGDEIGIDAPVHFPSRAKWANGLLNIARLHLGIEDEAGQTLWRAEYPFGFDHGIIVREHFGSKTPDLSRRPDPTSAAFVLEFRRYILDRIPDFRVLTTRDGAPSDFYLEDPAGAHDLDLSREDGLDQVTTLLVDLFPDWQDALCAAAMWIHHPSVTRHSSTWSRVSNGSSVETIPRLGGCFCGDTARLGACLSEKVGDRLAVSLKGFSMGLRGHLATLVRSPIGDVVIDGMLGLWFHTLDNTRLATLDEMRSQREIAERVWYAPRAYAGEFFYQNRNQLIRDWQSGPLVWPPNV